VNTALMRAAPEGDASGIAATEANPGANTATLAVTPQQAGELAGAQKSVSDSNVEKQLWVSLRPFGDHTVLTDLPACQVIPGS
jgi:hypothetical protein